MTLRRVASSVENTDCDLYLYRILYMAMLTHVQYTYVYSYVRSYKAMYSYVA